MPDERVQPPRLPRRLDRAPLEALTDQLELSMLRLDGGDFSSQEATGLILEEVIVERTSLAETRLDRVRVLDAQWSTCDLSGGVWESARLVRTAFVECRLMGLHLVEAALTDVCFSACNMMGAIFVGADTSHVAFDGCNLREASFQSTRLEGASFRDCDLRGADFQGALLTGADFRGAVIDGMRIGPVEIQGAIFEPAQAAQVVVLLGVEIRDKDDDQRGEG